MENFDSAQEWQRLSEYYREISDEELMALAHQYSELTGVAQQVLTREISSRGLNIPMVNAEKTRPKPVPALSLDADSPYAEDRKLVKFGAVWSVRDAMQLQNLLDSAAIPFVMGAEEATQADEVTSNFSDGVIVQVMTIGVPWAREATKYYAPEDEPDTDKEDGVEVHCPRCHSEDIVLGDPDAPPETTADSAETFKWMCVSCNHRWEGDGIDTAQ